MTDVPDWACSIVSRETLEKLRSLHDLITKWNSKINLVSRSDEKHLWDRHIWDSVQIGLHTKNPAKYIDVGSGGGFPGLVCAMVLSEQARGLTMTLVESDHRKSAFLRNAIRELQLSVTVERRRVEEFQSSPVDLLTARAFAKISKTLDLTSHLTNINTKFLLMKGRSWRSEIEAAKEQWTFDWSAHPSKVEPESAIIELRHVCRVSN